MNSQDKNQDSNTPKVNDEQDLEIAYAKENKDINNRSTISKHSALRNPIENEEELLEEVTENFFWVKILMIVFILGCLVLTFIFFKELKAEFLSFLEYMKTHLLIGTVVIIIIKIIGTILYVPGILLAISVGFAYKTTLNSYLLSIPIGVLVISIGSAIGCSCAFFLGRYLLKSWLHSKLCKLRIYVALDRSLKNHGLRTNFLLRLTPLIPYNIVNYFLGVTSSTYRDYLLGLIGFLPLLIIYVFIGSTLNDLADMTIKDNELELVLLIVSLILSVLCIYLITQMAKRELYTELNDNTSDRLDSEICGAKDGITMVQPK